MQTRDNQEDGDLKFWWIPQIPGKAFEVEITTIAEGRKLEEVFANYDLFCLEQNVRPDFSNMGGIVRFDKGEWWDVEDDEDDANA